MLDIDQYDTLLMIVNTAASRLSSLYAVVAVYSLLKLPFLLEDWFSIFDIVIPLELRCHGL